MEEHDIEESDRGKEQSTAFAITGYDITRSLRRYRPIHKAKHGLDPIFEDINNYSIDGARPETSLCDISGNDVRFTNKRINSAFNPDYEDISEIDGGFKTNRRSNSIYTARRSNFGADNYRVFNHDYEDIKDVECGFATNKRRSNSMYTARRSNVGKENMLHDLMNSRLHTRRKTEPSNQMNVQFELQSPDLNVLGTKSVKGNKKFDDLKVARSSLYHKGNLFVDNVIDRKDENKKRWTKLEAEPPTDGHLCCPAEKKLERRGFRVLFVLIVIIVLVVLGLMIDSWLFTKVDGGATQLVWPNDTKTNA